MSIQIHTHLMFDGAAEEAMNYHVDLFPESEVHEARRFESGDHEGKLEYGSFSLAGSRFSCIDSPVKHNFSFTPSVSIFVDFDESAELERMYSALVTGGMALMPLDNYGFSELFGFVEDRFGVSWQLNLP